MSFTEEMLAVAKELLTEFGVSVMIRPPSSGLDPNTLLPADASGLDKPANVAPFTPGRADSTESSLLDEYVDTNRWFYAYTMFDILPGSNIVFPDGTQFKIRQIKRVLSQTTTVYYQLTTSEVK